MLTYLLLISFSAFHFVCPQPLKFISQVDSDFSIKCPEQHGVYQIDVDFMRDYLTQPDPFYEWKFSIYCKRFGLRHKTDPERELCEDKKLVSIAKEELVFEDSAMNCDCDQHLAGINGQIRTIADRKQRLIGLRCCKKKNNRVIIQNCSLTDPYPIYRNVAFGTDDLRSLLSARPKMFITGVSIYENMMLVQQCLISVSGHHKDAQPIKYKMVNDSGEITCGVANKTEDEEKNYLRVTKNEQFEVVWERPILGNGVGIAASSEFQLFTEQGTQCPDGHMVYSVSKYTRMEQDTKDYVFHLRCANFEPLICVTSCSWNATCDEENINNVCGTQNGANTTTLCSRYVAGIKSTYNVTTNQRTFLFYCCNTLERVFHNCQWTDMQKDSDVKMILPKPRLRNRDGGVADALVIREIFWQYKGQNLQIQYHICDTFAFNTTHPCLRNDANDMADTPQAINPLDYVDPLNYIDYPTTCTSGINFVVMMDSTFSLGPSGYAAEIAFIIELLSYFNFDSSLGIASSQLTLLEFGDSVTTQISFTDYTDTTANEDIAYVIDSLTWQQSSTTNILDTLITANDIISSIDVSDLRPTVAIMLTDGFNSVPDTSPSTQTQVSDAAIALQTTVGSDNFYGIGMTTDANEELQNWVASEQYMYADTTDTLTTLANTIISRASIVC